MKKIAFVLIFLFLFSSCAIVRYQKEKEVFGLYSDFIILNSCLILSSDGKTAIVVLDDPKTPEVVDALIIGSGGRAIEFWHFVGGKTERIIITP